MLELDLKKSFPGFSLKIAFKAEAEIVVLFGPCGAGKSMTLKLVAGLERPDSGWIKSNGHHLFSSGLRIDVPIHKRKVGYVIQHYALFPHLSARQNIAYGLTGLSAGEKKQRVQAMIELMHLEEVAELHPGRLSGGEQQRVALARALVTEPDILLLDEPFSSLDASIRNELRVQLLNIFHQLAMPVLFVTHDLAEAYALANKMVILDHGRLLQTGTREEVFHRPVSQQVARLTGTRNILKGRVSQLRIESLVISYKGYPIEVGYQPDTRPELAPGQEIFFCIRPENVMFVKETPGIWSSPPANVIPGIIVREISHGATHTLFFKVGKNPDYSHPDHDLEIELQTHAYTRLGLNNLKSCAVSLKKERIYLLPN